MLKSLFSSAPSDFDTLVAKLNEIYSLLAVARSDQSVVIEFNDDLKDDKLVTYIYGHMFTNSSNPASELREFHNILADNIKRNRIITINLK